MAFEFTCPHCHHRTRVDDRYAGMSGNCVNCGREIALPAKKGEPRIDIGLAPRTSPTLASSPLATSPLASPPLPSSALAPAEAASASAAAGVAPGVAPGVASEVGRNKKRRSAMAEVLAIPLVGFMVRFAGLLLIAIPLMIGLYFVLTPQLEGVRERRNVAQCRNNMQRIALALNNYAEMYGSYPPPVVNDAAGKPLYSWRVLILPMLGYEGLYSEFDLKGAWDSPVNLSLASRMPAVYASPASPDALAMGEANYMLITGPGTLFPPKGPLRPIDVTDRAGETLLVVETRNSVAAWSAPGDLTVQNLNLQIGGTGVAIGGNHSEVAPVATVDGDTLALPYDTPGQVVRALVSPNGRETIDSEVWILPNR